MPIAPRLGPSTRDDALLESSGSSMGKQQLQLETKLS